MSKQRAVELISLGDRLWTDKAPLNALCQEIAENVYPERADFTTVRYLGENFSDNLMDSYPTLMRRELGNSFSSLLRPRGKPWFTASTRDDELDRDPAVAQFLEYLTNVTRQHMYDPRADLVGVTKMGDHDYVTFGQCVITVEEAANRQHLFYRNFHFKDVAFLENDLNKIDHVHRKDQMIARVAARMFGVKNLHESMRQALEREPGKKFQLRVVVMPSDEYDMIAKAAGGGKGTDSNEGDLKGGSKGHPYTVVYIDVDNAHIIKEGGLKLFPYLIPRWHRISGFQYAFSPAAMTSLPDSRMMQMMSRIILEAGEKSIDPPVIALEERIRDANLASGSITWVDAEYDGKVTDAFAPVHLNHDMKAGFSMRQDLREIMNRTWFLDKLSLPEASREMTAFETAKRIEDHVRNLLPLFEPVEQDYNNGLLDKSFDILNQMKVYDWSRMPDSLSNRDIFWSFKNPMQEASERILVEQYGEVLQLLQGAQAFGMQVPPVKIEVALKDAVRGTGAPAGWRKTQEEIDADAQEALKRQQIQGMAQELGQAGQVATQVGQGVQKLQGAGLLPPGKHAQGGQPQAPQRGRGRGGPPVRPSRIPATLPLAPPQMAPQQQGPAIQTLNPEAVPTTGPQ